MILVTVLCLIFLVRFRPHCMLTPGFNEEDQFDSKRKPAEQNGLLSQVVHVSHHKVTTAPQQCPEGTMFAALYVPYVF